MNLLLLDPSDRIPGAAADSFRVDGPRGRHLREVLGAEVGRTLRVGLLEGPSGAGTVTRADGELFEIACTFPDTAPMRRALTDLIVAIPRAKSLRKLLPEVTALGVDRIVLIRTWRVAKPFLSQSILDPQEFGPLLRDGMMQGRTTREPRVSVEPLFRPFVEDRLPSILEGARGFVAHPGAGTDVASIRLGPTERAVIAVGPEGGFTPFEVGALASAGLLPVSMGERTVRVETACVALLAQFDLLRRLSR